MRRLLLVLAVPALGLVACGGDDDDAGSFCDRAVAFEEQFAELEAQFEGEELPSADAFEEVAGAIDGLADGAPDEVEDDLGTIADAVRQFADVMADIDFSDPDALNDPALLETQEELETASEEVEAASQRVEAYLESECGITIDDEE